MVEPEMRSDGGSGGQGADQRRVRGRAALGWAGGWGAIVALATWLSRLSPIWLAVLVVGSVVWTVFAVRSRGPLHLLAATLLWLGTAVAGTTQFRIHEIVSGWAAMGVEVEELSADALGEALDEMINQGEDAVAGAAAAAGDFPDDLTSAPLFARLEEVRRGTGISAVALFAPDGSPVAWAGEHRGEIPLAARRGTRGYIYNDGPLFGYLYFVRRLSDGNTAVAAFLLESSVAVAEGSPPFADRFDGRHGARPQFCAPEMPCVEAVWEWATDDGPIMSVGFAGLTQQSWWERAAGWGRGMGGMIGLIAFLALAAAWHRARMAPSGVPVAVGTAALVIAPLGRVTGAERIFSPLDFVLPGPLAITLGVLLTLLGGGALWLLTRSEGAPGRPLPLRVTAPLMALVFPIALALVDRSISAGLLAARPSGGFAVQLATALLIAVPIFLLLRASRPVADPGRASVLMGVAAYVIPAVLATAVLILWHPERTVPLALFGAWAVPAALLAAATGDRPVATGQTVRLWLFSGWLAGTAALAFLWPLHVESRLALAEREVSLLGTPEDRYLDFLLREFAEEAEVLVAEGETGVNLLYHSWVGSGLAREGYEARIGLWRGEALETELNLSELDTLTAPVVSEVTEPRTEPLVRYYAGEEGLHYLLVVPAPDDRTISVAIPPRRRISAATPLARLLQPGTSTEGVAGGEALYLVPVDAGSAAAGHLMTPRADTVQWVRTDRWWRSETLVQMPEGLVHAHLDVATPGVPLLLTRGTLIQAAILITMLALWLLARFICRELDAVPFLRTQWLRSFRGRLSISLFVFFLLPTLVFGAASYSAVAREVVRSAAALAQQALDQAAARMPVTTFGQLGAVSGSDLLLYRQGSLAAATAPEILELGLFDSWLTPGVYLRLAGGQDVEELEERRLAQSEYLVAYRRLDTQRVLAAPIPLASQEITRRQQEFRDVALLVILLGMGLSVVLALLVSRALARPLDELSRAALTVGEGDLETRLPERRPDEFGSLYASFNRMVARLHRTRAALEQETRRTETIVAEAATGVLALDAAGRVELINPRAAEILGLPIGPGDLLLSGDVGEGTLSAAISQLWASRAPEAATELELDGRIVRLRLRRLPGEEDGGGAVVAVEDLTAEVRTARVLAWGEMARQVAHEIKNPLTPIKLAVQHVRRAFYDQRTDFGDILDRNVEAILREIDRLGEIARAFSRFGSPAAADSPLETVDVRAAVTETLALYGGGEEIVFRSDLPDAPLPRVVARGTELKEVLVNLLENAREAMDGGGEIVVSARAAEGGRRVSLLVTDTGVGIPAEQIDQIFEPHFSTRSSGTGLGLAIVRRIADSWGAEIRVHSRVGEGTRIEIVLRAAEVPDVLVGT